jgi:hypothetical protein
MDASLGIPTMPTSQECNLMKMTMLKSQEWILLSSQEWIWQTRIWKILPHKLLRLMISTYPYLIHHQWRWKLQPKMT